MDDPRAIITINDGRNHLAVTPRKYDVITSDPFEPVMAGAANLYTVEHFRSAKNRLAEGGIMCQYLPLYELPKEDVVTIMRSFTHVFPECLQFFTGYDTILLGFRDGIKMDASALKRKFEIDLVRKSLKDLGITRPEIILSLFVADLSKGRASLGSDMLNTDNYPVIEFSAPKSSLYYTVGINQQLLMDSFSDLPDELLNGFSEAEINVITKGRKALLKTLQAYALRDKAKNPADMEKALKLLFDAIKQAPESPLVRNELVEVLVISANMLSISSKSLEQAFTQYQMALRYDPDHFWALYNLSGLAMRIGQIDHAKHWIDQGLHAYPESPLFFALRGRYKGRKGDIEGGCEDVRSALDALPQKWDLWEVYSYLLKAKGDKVGAAKALAKAKELAPETTKFME